MISPALSTFVQTDGTDPLEAKHYSFWQAFGVLASILEPCL